MAHTTPRVCLAVGAAGGTGTLAKKVARDSRLTGSAGSHIDRSFEALVKVTQLAVLAQEDWHQQHGLILSASAVAVAEDYIRSILTDLVSLCPIVKRNAGSQSTRLEYVFSGNVGEAVRAVLDRESFSSQKTINDWLKTLVGSTTDKNRSAVVALEEFERVCHIRHCAIHAGGYVSSHNARVLGIEAGSWIAFETPDAIHEIIGVVVATIRVLNQHIFSSVVSKWIDEGVLSGQWTSDRDLFAPMWRAFYSAKDSESGTLNGDPLARRAYDAYRSVQGAALARSGHA